MHIKKRYFNQSFTKAYSKLKIFKTRNTQQYQTTRNQFCTRSGSGMLSTSVYLHEKKKFKYTASIIQKDQEDCVIQKISFLVFIYIASSRQHKQTSLRLSKAKHRLSHAFHFQNGFNLSFMPTQQRPKALKISFLVNTY
ncbi:Hypothetical_protein [Hexamita inflata]|uniref:Hypothetical_protein n=1 Tax=Hexamita inflata TaxID=28002 RepID=A0AA86NGF5_9EUKA|nr:Hypothetical protein HINF_LOCUS6201 [Hexamita inflata]CAI9918575.1 Hypothetical protein HINF_LOCUS6220 [Hexamita inflata]